MSLRKLSQPDLRALRAIILDVIDKGDQYGAQWVFYGADELVVENEREDFCGAIQSRIYTSRDPRPAPINKEYKQASPEVAAVIFRWSNGRRLIDPDGRVVTNLMQSADGVFCLAQFDNDDAEWFQVKPEELADDETLPERKGGTG